MQTNHFTTLIQIHYLRRPAVLRLRAERYTYKKNFRVRHLRYVFSNMLVVIKKNSTIEGEKNLLTFRHAAWLPLCAPWPVRLLLRSRVETATAVTNHVMVTLFALEL